MVKIRWLGLLCSHAELLARFLVPRMVLISVVLDVHSVPVQQYGSG
jgi:hypothetical protein